ncbi:MAG: T9SS type A sorting domain-containing protein [Ignavibacterium sp.]
MGNDVYVGGKLFPGFLAKWDGNNWSSLGSGPNLWVNAICVKGTDIYVGGEFTSAGGKPSYYFGIYHTILTDVNFDGNNLPQTFQLNQNYPNPFNPSTKISWQSPVSGYTTLKVYDVLGKEVATLVNEYRNAGSYEVEFNVGQTFSLSSGIYFYKLQVGEFIQTKKMILAK